EVQALAIDRLDAIGRAGGEQVGAEVGDLAVADQDGAFVFLVGCRIDDAGIDVGGRSGVRQCSAQNAAAHGAAGMEWRRPTISASRQAMRTATPISTCSWMTLRSRSSATSESISTPRFIGPGCMIRASGLATLSFSWSRPKKRKYSLIDGTKEPC